MKKNTFLKYVSIIVVLLLSILFVAKFGGPRILRFYVESGIGDCRKIPIICMSPAEEIIAPRINKEYLAQLSACEFPKTVISVPEGFTVVQERIRKVYYKRKKRKDSEAIIYLLYQEPIFFVNLFPHLKKKGIRDDYEFIKRTMYAKIKDIKNLTDAFFVIMKGIFIPDLGSQKDVKMAQFKIGGKSCFINYNLAKPDNYFDCNIISRDGFFKVYIKDRGANLDLDKVLTIISTVNKAK